MKISCQLYFKMPFLPLIVLQVPVGNPNALMLSFAAHQIPSKGVLKKGESTLFLRKETPWLRNSGMDLYLLTN